MPVDLRVEIEDLVGAQGLVYRVDARLREPRHEAGERRFVDAALVHRRERERAQSREHQPGRSGWPSALSRKTPARASAKRVASPVDIADVVTRSAGRL
jgi:hypothetical protein